MSKRLPILQEVRSRPSLLIGLRTARQGQEEVLKHDADMYRRHVHDRMGRLIATEIKCVDVAHVLDEIAQTASGVHANRALTLISAVINWAQ